MAAFTPDPDILEPGGFQIHPEYEQLPEAFKHMVTAEEYAWLGPEGRRQLTDDLCLPDWEEP